MKANFTAEEVNYFLEGTYEIIKELTKEPIPDRKTILYYSTKEDYEKKLRELKQQNDKIIKELSDELIDLKEELTEAEECSNKDKIEDLKRETVRIEEELDVSISVAEDLEQKLYIIQEIMDKIKTKEIIEKTSKNYKREIVNLKTINLKNCIVLANQGFQTITASSGDGYEAIKLIVLMETGETATGLIRGIWTQTAIHLKRNDKVNFINAVIPNWEEARIFHIFDKYLRMSKEYPVSYMIIEPDLLYQATTLCATVLQNDIYCSKIYKLNKLNNQNKINIPMLKGLIINAIVDKYLLNFGKFDIEEELKEILSSYKIELTYFCNDTSFLSDLKSNLVKHYENIKKIFPSSEAMEFKSNNIFPNMFEPHLLSPSFGLEGRLDLYYKSPTDTKDKIYEVKSGNVHYSHSYQLWIYKLLYFSIHNIFPDTAKLLYTKNNINPLKEPSITTTNPNKAIDPSQLVINLRNILALIDLEDAQNLREDSLDSLERTCPEIPFYMKNPDLCNNCKLYKDKCLYNRNLYNMIETYNNDDTETQQRDNSLSTYYKGFLNLINRDELANKFRASFLWYSTIEEKKQNFAIIKDLEIIEVADNIIKLKITDNQNIADYKIGDSVFLHREEDVTKGMLFKSTIRSINKYKITLKLDKSYISNIRELKDGWILDKTFYLYGSQKERNGLYKFINSMIERGDNGRFIKLILGRISPEFNNTDIENQEIKYLNSTKFNHKQLEAIKKSICCKDYCIIQGPPGTGKTYTLASLVYELAMRGEKILLTGFTNRSVDNALILLKDAHNYHNFIRIGSYYNIDNEIKPYSVEEFIKKYSINDLDKLKQAIENVSIFSSTAFSVDNFLIDNTTFDTVIVDESSQMTEPSALLVITRGKRFILFGDHKQLPPIVNIEQLKDLQFHPNNNMELTSLNQSLFERLIKIDEKNKLSRSISPISFLNIQYRMNKNIAEFPNKEFYNNKLISSKDNAERLLGIDLKKINPPYRDYLHPKNSIIFINIKSNEISKENYNEAKIVKRTVENLLKGSVNNDDIGIITPYKAQCSLIRRELESLKEIKKYKGEIIVDTVERYQGGHKEIIIVSFVVGDNDMMKFLSEDLEEFNNNIEEGLNRKLNVIITRARSKLILVGNKSVLTQDSVYKKFIEYLDKYSLIFEYQPELQPKLQPELDSLF